jgi:DNA end-binding protein Ku
MAPRPNWKGYLKLSLVSCPVALYPATTTSQRIRFNIINRKTGNRIRNEVVDAETGEPVPQEDRVKGYEFEKGQYVLIEEEEFDHVALESTHTIDIEQFVPMAEVDRIYLDESFYLVPADDMGQEAFAVIREAMKKDDLVGLARLVIYRREHLLLLAPRGKGIMATTLRYKNEVRAEQTYFDEIKDIKVAPEMLKLALQILESKRGHFDPSKFEDRYENALMQLIDAKRAGRKPPVAAAARPSNVINLMDALRRSARGGPARQVPARRSLTRKRAGAKRKVRRAG